MLSWFAVTFVLVAPGIPDRLLGVKYVDRASEYKAARLDGDTLYLSFTTRKVPGRFPQNPVASVGRPAWAKVKLQSIAWGSPDSEKMLSDDIKSGAVIEYSDNPAGFDVAARGLPLRIVSVEAGGLQCVGGIVGCQGGKEQIDAFRALVAKTARDCAPCMVPYTSYGNFVLARKSEHGIELAVVPAPYGQFAPWGPLVAALLYPADLVIEMLLAVGNRSH